MAVKKYAVATAAGFTFLELQSLRKSVMLENCLIGNYHGSSEMCMIIGETEQRTMLINAMDMLNL